MTPNLKAGAPVVTTAEDEYIYAIKDFLADSSHQYGTSTTKITNIRCEWDMKRRLKNWRVNPWTGYSETEPWKNADQYVLARLIRDGELPEDEKIRRLEAIPEDPDLEAAYTELYPAPRPKLPPERIAEVKRLRGLGRSIRQIASELGMGIGTVARILRS